jgi:LPS-assembly lipoprotein
VTSDAASQVAVDVRRALATGSTRVARTAAEGEAHLRILNETREKVIYTITGAGRVYEYQLRLLVSYQVEVPGAEAPVVPATQIELRRLITYSETAPVAKEAEEQLLYRDMVADATSQILRRIAVVRRAA